MRSDIQDLLDAGGQKKEDYDNPWLAYERFKKALGNLYPVIRGKEYDEAIAAYVKRWKL